MYYKGGTRHWSNRYHFNGGTPSDTAHWTTISDLIVPDEAACLAPEHTVIETFGYAAGSDVPVFSKTYSQAGTLSQGTGEHPGPGAVCGLIRWSTTARTSKNHPVYLFSYMHGPSIASGSDVDSMTGAQRTAYEEYADDWMAGYSDGVNTYVRAGPNGATGTARFVTPWVTHRDFPT